MPTNFETMGSESEMDSEMDSERDSEGAMEQDQADRMGGEDRSGPGVMGSLRSSLQRTGQGQGSEMEEGETTKQIEHVTAKAPSLTFLALAGAAMVGSLALFLSGKRETGIFVGLWPLAMLSVGNYNKLVKVLDSDRQDRGASAA